MKSLKLIFTAISLISLTGVSSACKFAAKNATLKSVDIQDVDVQVDAKVLDVPGTYVFDLSTEPQIATATIQQNNQNFVINSDQLVVLNVAPTPGLSTDFIIQTTTKKMTLHVEVSIADQTAGLPAVWGQNTNGNMNLTGSSSVADSPVLASSTALQFKQIAMANSHVCGIVSDGTAYCWGEGDDGRLGTNATTDSATPLAVSTSLKFKFIAVSGTAWGSDRAHSCAISLVGKVYCWGRNTYGQLGVGTTASSLVPTAISLSERFTALTLGADFSCGLTETQTVYCWGANDHGQLGRGNTTNSLVPVLVSGTYTQISVGFDQSICAIHSVNKHLYCWGNHDRGVTTYIPDSSATTVDDMMVYLTSPNIFEASRTYKSVSGGASSFCAIDSTDDLYCWGSEMYGRLGIAGAKNFLGIQYVPAKVSGATKFKMVSVGHTHSVAIDMNDDLWAFGQNDGGGVLGVGFETTSPVLPVEGPYGLYAPYRLNDTAKYASVFAGATINFGIRK